VRVYNKESAQMDFRITGLPVAQFAPLFGLAEPKLTAQGVIRYVADHNPGFPCRVSLQDAAVGDPVLLLNYEHLSVSGPYRSRHAIYVREYAVEVRPAVNQVPDALRIRLMSVRAFDNGGMMVDADVVEGASVDQLISRYLDNPQVAYLHLHNARRGCFAARAERA
jgi:hypothetical protein